MEEISKSQSKLQDLGSNEIKGTQKFRMKICNFIDLPRVTCRLGKERKERKERKEGKEKKKRKTFGRIENRVSKGKNRVFKKEGKINAGGEFSLGGLQQTKK